MFKASFLKSIRKIKDPSVKKLVTSVIIDCENAKTIADISHCEALKSRGKFFKLKHGRYRFGVKIDAGLVYFIKFGTRQNFYDDFPPV